MKKIIHLIFAGSIAFLLISGCGKAKENESVQTNNFSKKSMEGLKEKAKRYTEKELQNGEVPLNAFIQLSGRISKSDSKDERIQKGDRFILISGDSSYQVFNEQKKLLSVGDEITVYGEYYGFLKGQLIERNEEE